ncbi:DUF1178 family protein [Novosphingobium bradum]|uniref:DUF1178 family protein n=1 Tax=Novosphingobium bradum TaxID=1737444 RepID=A0ABV7ITY0_9SPHN
MIVYDLECRAGGHRFEGWFGSSTDFEQQRERGLLSCPVCGAADVAKAVMAPAVPRKGNQMPVQARESRGEGGSSAPPQPKTPVATGAPSLPPQAAALLRAYAAAQAEALKASKWVGDDFPEQARAMHYGEEDQAPIHGQATADEARELIEEGIAVAPVLFPVVPPDKAN